MSFDGMVMRAVAHETNELLKGGRVTKIYQPYATDLLLVVRSGGKNHQLLLSANPSYARIQITKESYANPKEPPMFCMLLRKHLEGSIIEEIKQIDNERIIHVTFKARNDLGDLTTRTLIAEIMGRHSNVILLNESNMILDSIKHLSPSVNRYRTVLPGQDYVAPPAQNKVSPFGLSTDDFLRQIDFNAGKLSKQLVQAFGGVSPLIANEVVHRAGLANRSTLPEAFFDVFNQLGDHHYTPHMVTASKEYFSVVPLTHLSGESRTFDSTSELLDRFYYGKADRDRVKQQSNDLERFLSNELKKNEKKIEKLSRTIKQAQEADTFQLLGELLTANMHMVKRGDKKVSVQNYYDEDGGMVEIELNPQKSPSENAQAYFKKYNKAKNSISVLEEQIEMAHQEIAYLDQLIQQLTAASPRDIEEIREELEEEGYIKKRSRKKKKPKPTKPQLDVYESTDGTEILVGKNNKQNEYLTNKLAARSETWLHTKDIPGSHVVIRSKEYSEQTLLEAANLAAYFSKARESGSVPVDYTEVRHVKKPNGAKPGFVTYDQQNTLYVTPDQDLIFKMKK
ncbi:Rqc2 family fibronectin-binding protein [Pseudalkalibacillus hwajinpoensis]|uniref:Rqc2 homolog RqcH n=1 Tax=Guptibacillus hwajinpoensis TaxID=208199 RepID=A0A4U1MM49_9BACL|nr:NFACT RNA binding domain-containing protein [Pseudalkalibacillus hwajinpoensis]TKD71715.1 fibronectin/fibrinogen-binding protein [Pseudalkalibacillus hwajinpoensis]